MIIAAGCSGGSGAPSPGDVLVIGGPGRSDGCFYRPRALAASAERLYVADMTGRLQVLDLDGRWLATWKLPEINRGFPTGVGVSPSGFVAIADTHNYVVRVYDADGREKRVIGGEGGKPGQFTYVTDAEFDRAGNMYTSEHGREDRIQKFDAEGKYLRSWGHTGTEPGEFRRPQALAVDPQGFVFVADAANHRIQKFTDEGKLVAVWGEAGTGPGQLLYPYGLALTEQGYLVVAEYGNNRIQAFDPEGHCAGIWGGPGHEAGRFALPWGVAWVEGRGIYVSDRDNHRVQVLRKPFQSAAAGRTERMKNKGSLQNANFKLKKRVKVKLRNARNSRNTGMKKEGLRGKGWGKRFFSSVPQACSLKPHA